MLVSLGYRVVSEDEDNWALFKADAEHPVFTIPKDGETVSLAVMMPILHRLKMDDLTYFELVRKVQGVVPAAPPGSTAVPDVTPSP